MPSLALEPALNWLVPYPRHSFRGGPLSFTSLTSFTSFTAHTSLPLC